MKLYKLFMILSTIFSPYSLLYAFLPVFFFLFVCALSFLSRYPHLIPVLQAHLVHIDCQIFPLLSRFIHNSTTPIKNTVSYFKKEFILERQRKKDEKQCGFLLIFSAFSYIMI